MTECLGDEPIKKQLEQIKEERDTLYVHVSGLLTLLQLVRGREDIPPEISKFLRNNHRTTDAAAYLAQIIPPK